MNESEAKELAEAKHHAWLVDENARLTAENARLRKLLGLARGELLCLGADLEEIESGIRTRPTALLNDEVMEMITEALTPASARKEKQ